MDNQLTKTLSFFAEPDHGIQSMPFGVQKKYPGDAKTSPPPILQQYSSQNLQNTNSIQEQQEAPFLATQKNYFASPWTIFFSAALILMLIFIFLKSKKVI
jgi:hypothetical protein